MTRDYPCLARRRIARPAKITVKPTRTAAEITRKRRLNSLMPADPSATWFRWNAGQMTASRSRNFGSGMNSPDRHSIGRKIRFANAGADDPGRVGADEQADRGERNRANRHDHGHDRQLRGREADLSRHKRRGDERDHR